MIELRAESNTGMAAKHRRLGAGDSPLRDPLRGSLRVESAMLTFAAKHPMKESDAMTSAERIRADYAAAVASSSVDRLDEAAQQILSSADPSVFIDLLNELLVAHGHRSHQRVARALQKARSPSSISFVQRAVEGGFAYLDYTCSEPEVLAKWFGWLLFDIGTPEAIALIRRFGESADDAIRSEMRYRLTKLPG